MRFLIILALVGLSVTELTNYNEFLTFAAKNHIRSVSDYAVSNGFINFDEEFEKFKTDLNKLYLKTDEEFRKFYFLKSLEYIKSHNELYKKGEVYHELGVNHFADWTPDEYKQMQNIRNMVIPVNVTHIEETEKVLYESLPPTFDWRSMNKVTPVKNQGNCGACWAFSTCAAVEAAYAIKYNQLLSLSEQQLLDCSSNTKYNNNGCNGGSLDNAYEYFYDYGLELSADYPYQEKLTQCRYSASKSLTRIAGFRRLHFPATDLEMMNAIYNHGPISAAVDGSGSDFTLYRAGIISTAGNNNFTNHDITIIGWGSENGVDYWIIKNSWSTTWGESGFGRLIRGRNIRHINTFAFYPVLQSTKEDIQIFNTELSLSQQQQALEIILSVFSHSITIDSIAQKLSQEFAKSFGGNWTAVVIKGYCGASFAYYHKKGSYLYFNFNSYEATLFNSDYSSTS